ncbi:MAG: class II aldolase/adducin family protein [Acetobacteraceae bacterium]|nr:class II aldolase/adducin family protein [Acetobacteraceae bacterium]
MDDGPRFGATPLRIAPLRDRVSEAEWQARLDLAACYRLCDHFGMTDMIATHISARVPGSPGEFLVIAHGLLFGEVTASSLLKADLDGRVTLQPEFGPGLPDYDLQPAAFVIHSAIYRARADVMAAIHTHTTAGMAVSALQCGLLPLTQTAHRFTGRVAYHDFNGPERDPSERDAIAGHLGDMNLMILRNHGLLTVGQSVAEAFSYMFGLERACQAQVAAMACNTTLNVLPQAIVDKSAAMYAPGATRSYGRKEWPGLLRMLDRRDPSWRE